MPKAPDCIQPNPMERLRRKLKRSGYGYGKGYEWVRENTAMLVIHGIGNQLPMETLEQFGKGLIEAYKNAGDPNDYIVEHRLRTKEADDDTREWWDNYVRIRRAGDDPETAPGIDLYEYYWAHYTEGKADWDDVNDWIQGITTGARRYYKRNMRLAALYGDQSLLTYHKGQSRDFRYFLFIGAISHFIVLGKFLGKWINKMLSYIPFIGAFISGGLESLSRSTSTIVTNVLVDLVAYNVTDAKSKYYPVRRAILDGAVRAVTALLEDGETAPDKDEQTGAMKKFLVSRKYPQVLIAGHSLGSVVAFDTINRINLMVNACQLQSYSKYGISTCAGDKGRIIADQLRGFITFGSPLDKVAFFLRENLPDNQFVRQQLLNDFVGFKQRDLAPWLAEVNKDFFRIENKATPGRLLEDIRWRNYFDKADYVSGDLDYYDKLTNVDCRFGARTWFAFTHSNYWTHEPFYDDIIRNFLEPGT